MTSEWPKPWDEIYEAPETLGILMADGYVVVADGAMRIYESELYVPVGDEWAPLDVYIDLRVEEALDRRPTYRLGDRQI